MTQSKPVLRLTVATNNHFICYTYSLFYQIFWRYWEKEYLHLCVPGANSSWILAGTRDITEECKCGSNFRTANGGTFKRAFPNLRLEKMEAVLETFHSPALCERCFYLKEWQDKNRRHLVPMRWQEEFG